MVVAGVGSIPGLERVWCLLGVALIIYVIRNCALAYLFKKNHVVIAVNLWGAFAASLLGNQTLSTRRSGPSHGQTCVLALDRVTAIVLHNR